MTSAPRFATQIVGSYHKPHWIADHELVYAKEGVWWRVAPGLLEEAQDDAVRLAVFDQERAGLTYATDGEERRQTFSGHFYALGGIDSDEQGLVTNFGGDVLEYLTMKQRAITSDEDQKPAAPPEFRQPRVVGPITWERPLVVDAARFLQNTTSAMTKVTVIGPATLALRLVDEHYGSLDQVAFAVADALNKELRALDALGIDLIQLDEPEVHFRYSQVNAFAQEAIDRAFAGVTSRKAVHMCYGYSKNIAEKRSTPVYADALALLASTAADAISIEYAQPGHTPDLLEHAGDKTVILGVLDLDTEAPVESVDAIVARASAAVEVVGPDRIELAPDCGMWFLPRDTCFGKLQAMESAARILRTTHS
jgi:5-methyltetrahydropteroyltriglutamate--homocysteine methyltransferase